MKNIISKKKTNNYLLVGNPNVGKSTFFNRITWKTSPVSNIDRFTTTIYHAYLKKNKNIEIFDLPGVNSLNVHADDQQCTMDKILYGDYVSILNICSINSLKRDLYLTLDLLEAGVIGYLVINMIDEVDNSDLKKHVLTKFLKVPISLISAKKNINLGEVLYSLNSNTLTRKKIRINYSNKIENIINECSNIFNCENIEKRFIVIQAILGNITIIDFLKKQNIYDNFMDIFQKYKIDDNDVNDILKAKRDYINKIYKKIFNKNSDDSSKGNITNRKSKFYKKMDNIFLNPYFAIPAFFIILLLIYFLTFYEYTGGYIQSQLASSFESLQLIISESIYNLNQTDAQAWWSEFVANGLFGGIFTIFSFIPWIVILFFLTSILEQSGILSRMSIVLDNSLNHFGISGRSVINIISGVGCNVPSILLARNSNSTKEKMIAILISPFISCSARVVIFGYFGNIILNSSISWILIFFMTISSVIFALLIGYFFSNLLFRKKSSFFLTEVTKFRAPDFFTITKKIIYDLIDFIKKTILFVGITNLIVWILNYTSPDTIFINPLTTSISNNSFLYYLSFPFKYILYPIGLGYDWRFSISIISGFPAKEIVASNIDTLFGNSESLINSISLHTNLINSVLFTFITYISFYIPCMATISIIKNEIGWKYVIIHLIVSLLSSYIFSLIVFTISGSIELITIGYGNNYEVIIILFSLSLFMLTLILVTQLIKFLILNKYVINRIYLLLCKSITIVFLILFGILIITCNIMLLL